LLYSAPRCYHSFMFGEDARAKTSLYLAIFLLFMAYGGRFTGIEPFHNQFFTALSWTYLLIADLLLYRLAGRSPLLSAPLEFLLLAACSAGLAVIAELLNLRLEAWTYFNQSSELSLRWTGRLLAWAAVLPSILITADLLALFNFLRSIKTRPFQAGPRAQPAMLAAGGALLLTALIAPRYFWPLAVPAFFLITEPLNMRLGLPSVLREVAGGLPARAIRLAAAGLIAGLLWNFWNQASGAAWQYNLPGWLRSPAHYLGFPLLALAAYSAYCLASWLRSGRTWEGQPWNMPGRQPGPYAGWAAVAILIISSYIALRAVDAYTVRFYLGWI